MVLSCCTTPRSFSLDGIWIPKVIDWNDGNFSAFYFSKDSLIIVTSTQKLINDSIYFCAEPGYILKQGFVETTSSSIYYIKFRTLHKFLKFPDDTIPSSFIADSLVLHHNRAAINAFTFMGKEYVKDTLFTKQSVNAIQYMATKDVRTLNNE